MSDGESDPYEPTGPLQLDLDDADRESDGYEPHDGSVPDVASQSLQANIEGNYEPPMASENCDISHACNSPLSNNETYSALDENLENVLPITVSGDPQSPQTVAKEVATSQGDLQVCVPSSNACILT